MTPRTQIPEITALYKRYKANQIVSATHEHLDYLFRLASTCRHVTELGSDTGASSCAFLFAEPEVLVSVDLVRRPQMDVLQAAASKELSTKWTFRQEDSRTTELEPTDLLFIDSGHLDEVIRLELARHSGKVRRYIVMHDTVGFSEVVLHQPDAEGIWRAIAEFCREHPEWCLLQHFEHQYGLTVLARIDAFVCGQPAQAPPPQPKEGKPSRSAKPKADKAPKVPKVPKAKKPPVAKRNESDFVPIKPFDS